MRRLLQKTARAAVPVLVAATAACQPGKPDPMGHYRHLVVIYEENHSFDNLYGGWGTVGGQAVDGIGASGYRRRAAQVGQHGHVYRCLPQNDANLVTAADTVTFLDGSTHPGLLPASCASTHAAPPAPYNSAFRNRPFDITTYVRPKDNTCPPATASPAHGVRKGDPTGLPGGCTQDLVHRFYQEQYQLDGGRMDRYTTGSDAVGLTQGFYDTRQLPLYRYLHTAGAPHYVIADHFFQAAFGGSFLNHQFLVAGRAPTWPGAATNGGPTDHHSVLDSHGFPNTYPQYTPDRHGTDGPLTQACSLPTTVPGLACGDFAVNTIQPTNPPHGSGPQLPLIDDRAYPNIGDELTHRGVSWTWYAGGWDDAVAGHPDPLFQYHHQPFNYFADYAPGKPGRAHLQDETNFVAAAKSGTLPAVSFVKPLGEENEHPGYASTPTGETHLVDLIKTIMAGPQAKGTLIVVTYDEFGGQWDHVPPPGQGRPGVHDQFGPGTRIPTLVIGGTFTRSGVDSTTYDTTSILTTLENQYALPALSSREAQMPDLRATLLTGGDTRRPTS
jgi:phospholipase C